MVRAGQIDTMDAIASPAFSFGSPEERIEQGWQFSHAISASIQEDQKTATPGRIITHEEQ